MSSFTSPHWIPGRSRSGIEHATTAGSLAIRGTRVHPTWRRSGVEPTYSSIGATAFESSSQSFRRQPMQELLEQLHSTEGFAWNDVAKVVGVSRHAVAKWRRGESEPARDRWRRICRLAAFSEGLRSSDAIASEWVSAELEEADGSRSGIHVIDVLRLDLFEDALSHFRRQLSDAELLDKAMPGRNRGSESSLVSWTTDKTERHEDILVASVDELDLVAFGASQESIKADLKQQMSDYIAEWFEDLRLYQPHKQRRATVLAAFEASEDGKLDQFLFGE